MFYSLDEIWSLLPNGVVGFGHGPLILLCLVTDGCLWHSLPVSLPYMRHKSFV